MDIHPVHGPVNSVRDFFVHLAIITIGILIALSLEGLVEWAHHRALVREARDNILTEARKNKESINAEFHELKKREDELNHIIAVAYQLETAPNSFKSGSMTLDWTDQELYSTAWKTASTSGAATYMSYEELRRYTEVYDGQEDYADLDRRALTMMSNLFPLIQSTMRQDVKKMPRERFVEIQQDAYQGLLIVQALRNLCQNLDKEYGAILKKE